jgi:hypothetical protein
MREKEWKILLQREKKTKLGFFVKKLISLGGVFYGTFD